MKVRVRIAPSPTGFLHIGTARTALFNYLFAKKNNGQFILRIEDTDLERSDKKFEKDVIESLHWLGLDWDEGPINIAAEGQLLANQYKGDFGPYRQSERLDIYEKYLKQLLDKGNAYYCYCSKEELEEERQAMLSQGLAPRYSRHCLNNPPKNREPQLIRFKMPERRVSFKDMIRGEISFDTAMMGDIAIAKNTRTPLYNFAVAIDDQEMQITHVIRGEDHIANTPKQILLSEAFGFNKLHYAHLPLILDPDRSKMSKRFSATTIEEYKRQGHLPEAVINFLSLLGWHPQDNQEIFSLEQLIQAMDLSRVQKAGAVFNADKLAWINAQYVKKLSDEKILQKLNWEISDKNLKIIKLFKDRAQTINQFADLSLFFFQLPDYDAQILGWKDMAKEKIIKSLQAVYKLIEENKEKDIPEIAEKRGRGEIFWPLRASLSGQKESPGPLEIIDALGKEESLRRIQIAINKLQ
ncbi:MAG: glutamate--tRNA ligase [Patescibacteria group bacterium]